MYNKNLRKSWKVVNFLVLEMCEIMGVSIFAEKSFYQYGIRWSLKKKNRKKHFLCAAYRANTGRALKQKVKKNPENIWFWDADLCVEGI